MFYDRLKSVCKKKGTSPSSVAISIGMSKSAVTRWKNGQSPTVDVVVKISRLLGVPVEDLITEKETQ